MNEIEKIIKKIHEAINKSNQERVEADNKLLNDIKRVSVGLNNLNADYQVHKYRLELAASYSNSAAYSNVIMLGGYAATFALWNMIYSTMMPYQNFVVGILLMSSVFFFAAFEVYKMIAGVRKTSHMRNLLNAGSSHEKLNEQWAIAKDFYQVEESRFWTYQIWITVPTGFGAGAYLFGIMLDNLAMTLPV